MKIIFEKLIKDIIQPAIIIDKNKNVLYVNTNFANRFSLETDKQNNFRTTPLLNPLNIESLNKKAITDIRFTVFDQGDKINVSVYKLNMMEKMKNIFLVLFQTKSDDAATTIMRVPFETEEQLATDILTQEFKELIGENIAFKRALVLAQRAAKSNISVLITGESGTGKEILARAIHKASTRLAKPLIDVNCAAIPDTLIESELFGYEKGAFTGARAEGRKGYFDEAHEGTILLDEIGDASLQTQSKLLRVLEEGTFKRVGGTKNIKVDVRIISSTNRDLTALIEQKKFREDLFFRLNAFTIFLPPLRQRKEDIPLLVDHFLKSNSDIEKRKFKLSSSAMDILNSYHWPGNVRELKGVVSYAVNMSADNYIRPNSLPNFLFATGQTHEAYAYIPSFNEDFFNLAQATTELEKKLIRRALEQTSNKSMAIKKLGISRRTFYQKIKKYGLDYKP
ncbi:MAG TPA: sigma 54-interacting transcriptional regulator [Smithellaceae bacterium]|nr:sigma 54-interacting transcriptional regulator [Smithellaceae bacterium]HRS88317.1 sigma 54-interacting transcriptional regulator [Smithellaceae bacterium]HRV24962.1 sigma 54-interacting transcriptional regulator [Smithellaceae bacterium]